MSADASPLQPVPNLQALDATSTATPAGSGAVGCGSRAHQPRASGAALRWAWLPTAIAVLLVPLGARAQASLPQEVGYGQGAIETGRITATGGAQRALSNSIGALFINPANMAASRVYHVGGLASIWPEAGRQTYGAAAVDSVVSSMKLAGGLGAAYSHQDADGIDRRWTDLRFALALPISPQFMVGGGGRYMWLEQNGLGPLGYSYASGGLEDARIVRGLGIDAGLTVKPSDSLSLALVGSNINDPGNPFQPTSLGGGVGYGNPIFSVEADGSADFTTYSRTAYSGMAGASYLLADHYPLRAGYRYQDGPQTHAITAGIGYIDRQFGAQLGLRRLVAGERATVITFDIRYHVEASGLTPSPSDTF